MNYAKREKTDTTINHRKTYEYIIGVDVDDTKLIIMRLLTALGFKSKLLGTKYLEYAILYRYENSNEIFAGMTNRTYIAVANTCNTTPTRVERAIRNSIFNCHSTGALKRFNDLAQTPIIDDKYVPSNGEFICSVVNWLQLEKQSGRIK